jgi:hypothetical protein
MDELFYESLWSFKSSKNNSILAFIRRFTWKIAKFFKFCSLQKNIIWLPFQFIENIDKIPIAFDLPNSYTLEKCGSNTINIKTTGHERSTFTVILGCITNGSILPPVVIFKLKNIPWETFPNGIFVRVNAKGWVNENEMIWWIENV